MADKSKVYVIDPKSTVEALLQKGGVAQRGFERTEYSPDDEAKKGSWLKRAGRERRRRLSGPFEEQGSPLLSFLSYLAGPFAVLTTRHGRENTFWIVIAVISSIIATFLFARSGTLFAPPHGSGIAFIAWISLSCLTAVMGFAAWARGVYLIGRHRGHLLRKLPALLRNPGAAGLLGLLIPGYGLFVAGHARRAAAVLLATCAAAISAIVLWNAPDLWALSRVGILLGYGDILERIFLAMGAIGAFTAVVWIFQALDGARLAGAYAEGREPRRAESAAWAIGGWATAALVLAIAALLATFEPARVAETVDRFAVSMQADGLRVIPLAAAETAMLLDPSRPEYAMRAIGLNEELGLNAAANELRRDLAERWKPYERMLRLEAAADLAAPEPEMPQ